MSRLIDYALVALVIGVLVGLFRLSRIALRVLLSRLEVRFPRYSVDHVIVLGFTCLLAGLLILPLLSALLGLAGTERLPGGIVLHLVMVALSIILFSMSEDLFGGIRRSRRSADQWTLARHLRIAGPAILAFFLIGALFLSPIFYGGLSVLLVAFYAFALWCRPRETK
jgi:uncharacterized membrane protein